MLGRTNLGGSGGLVTVNGSPITDAVNIEFDNETVDTISMSTLPHKSSGNVSVVYNNEIHIIGFGTDKYHYKWDGSSWTSVSTAPYRTYSGASAVVYNNAIHILGGTSYPTNHYK